MKNCASLKAFGGNNVHDPVLRTQWKAMDCIFDDLIDHRLRKQTGPTSVVGQHQQTEASIRQTV
jgi:hypothetical protein